MRYYYLISLKDKTSFVSMTKPISDISPQFINCRGFYIDYKDVIVFRKNPSEFVNKEFKEKYNDSYFVINETVFVEKFLINDDVETYCHIDEHGTKCWFRGGMHHREGGPAKEYFNGTKEWYINNHFHREDGPAIEKADGSFVWYKKGKIHREDGPAVSDNTFNKWYFNGRLHREDGPAIERKDGEEKIWFKHDLCHREDGPAHILPNGIHHWYLNNVRLTEIDFKRKLAEKLL